MFKRKNKKPLIQFVTTMNGLESIQECIPKPAKHYMPSWWKDMPMYGETTRGFTAETVKICPSFPDFFSQGFVMPMWTDVRLNYNPETEDYTFNLPGNFQEVEMHSNPQFINYLPETLVLGQEFDFVFKFSTPWKIITPPGYSVLQIPLFYHFDKRFTALAGVIDTDIMHDISLQILYHQKNNPEGIIIKRGEPLVMYIPFKRKKYENVVRYLTEKDANLFEKNFLKIKSKFRGSGAYRTMQRERDKNK